MALKFAPDLKFRIDESFERSARIDALLASPAVQRDIGEPGLASGDDDHDQD